MITKLLLFDYKPLNTEKFFMDPSSSADEVLMKFYFVYEQAFPLGFGLTAILCLFVGFWGLYARRPLVFPFIVSFLCYIGVCVPLFLLAINHFLVAWPLDLGAALLNGSGIVLPILLLAYLWACGYEVTTVGARPETISKFLETKHEIQKGDCLKFPRSAICYLKRPTNEEPSEFRNELRSELTRDTVVVPLLGFFLCIIFGGISLLVAGISWCAATECVPYL